MGGDVFKTLVYNPCVGDCLYITSVKFQVPKYSSWNNHKMLVQRWVLPTTTNYWNNAQTQLVSSDVSLTGSFQGKIPLTHTLQCSADVSALRIRVSYERNLHIRIC